MQPIKWYEQHCHKFDSEFEHIFFKNVLMSVSNLDFNHLKAQMPFLDDDGRQRYCDFAICEDENVRVAIEVDGYDKRGTGEGMSHDDFVAWQRRQAALTAQGWHVLRFANRDVKNEPQRCCDNINSMLARLRKKSYREAEVNLLQENKTVNLLQEDKNLGILSTIKNNFSSFFYTWGAILILNQVFIFGGCFYPYCIMAAIPHTLILTVFGFFGYKKYIDT